MKRSRWAWGVGLWALGIGHWALGIGVTLSAQDMPDPAQIHGRAIPAPELPNGTVTVRVVRENIGNNVAGQEVRVTVGGASVTARTDELGRAEFSNLSRDADARAEATVDGERLESQPFPVPTTGGLRVILVAGLARAAERRKQEEAAAAAAPAIKGAVVLGGDSRVVMQFNDDALSVFYLLDIINNARARVDIGGPLIIDLPAGATDAAVREGSSPTATVDGTRLTVTGPFASGTTPVVVGFGLPHASSELLIEQAWPVPLQQVTVAVQRVGAVTVKSPQLVSTREFRTEDGQLFVIGSGPALQAGTPLAVTLSNLPVRSRTSRYVALSLAVGIALFGVWLGWGRRAPGGDSRGAMLKRRDTLLNSLAHLETKRRAGEVSIEKYTAQRKRQLAELEQIYADLDDAGAGPQGGGEGVAA